MDSFNETVLLLMNAIEQDCKMSGTPVPTEAIQKVRESIFNPKPFTCCALGDTCQGPVVESYNDCFRVGVSSDDDIGFLVCSVCRPNYDTEEKH